MSHRGGGCKEVKLQEEKTSYTLRGVGEWDTTKEREVDESRDVSRVGTEDVSNKYFGFLTMSQK